MKLQIKTVQFVFFIKENMFSEKWFLGRGLGGGGLSERRRERERVTCAGSLTFSCDP